MLRMLVLVFGILPLIQAQQVKTVKVGDTTLAYVEAGTGDPVVFVHGALGDWRTWESVRPFITPYYRYISLSRRHHYPNVWTDGGQKHTRAQHTEDVAAFIRAIGAGKVHLVGNSAGGGIVARVALKYPELLRTVVIGEAAGLLPISPAITASWTALQDELSKVRAAARRGDGVSATRLMFDAVVEPGAFDRLSREQQEQRLANWKTLALGSDDSTPTVACEELRRLKVPALVIRGETTREVFRLGVEQLLGCLPERTELAVIPRAHHGWNAANPEGSANAILAFLHKH